MAFEKVEETYKLSQVELSQKDGTGKLYGRPKRLAQEKIRFEMTKCEQAQLCLENIFNKIKQSTDYLEIRDLLITFRNCAGRYSFHIDALNQKASQMVRFSRNPDKFGIFLSENEIEKDKQLAEKELELLGPLSYQSDKSKKFTVLILEIEKLVKEDCQQIYLGAALKWITGADKLPDWIRPYLEQQRKNMNQFKINCCRNLRDICIQLYDYTPLINQQVFYSLQCSYDIQIKSEQDQIINNFNAEMEKDSELKNMHNFQLRPNFSNPACKEEFEDLCQRENKRQLNFKLNMEDFKKKYQNQEFTISNIFFVRLVNTFEFLVTFYDNYIYYEDFELLPGDDQKLKKNYNLQTLLKQKQDGIKIDYTSQRSISKMWPTFLVNSFKVDQQEFQFQPAEPPVNQEAPKGKGKAPPKKEEPVIINKTETRQVKSYKSVAQKSAFKQQINAFNQYKSRFDQSIEYLQNLIEENTTQEQKYILKFKKTCEDLKK